MTNEIGANAGYNYFHELLTCGELSRVGGGGVWALMGGLGIGLPPVLTFGNEEIKAPSAYLGIRFQKMCNNFADIQQMFFSLFVFACTFLFFFDI